MLTTLAIVPRELSRKINKYKRAEQFDFSLLESEVMQTGHPSRPHSKLRRCAWKRIVVTRSLQILDAGQGTVHTNKVISSLRELLYM